MKLLETKEREEAIIVGVVTGRARRHDVEEYLKELVLLTDTAGADVRHMISQERDRIDAATFIGSGKARAIGEIVDEEKIDLVIFDDDLSPVQIRNLEKYIKCKIIDRSGLILDIFASRAKTKEAMTQVELAQLQYVLPRLTRQWTHLSKQYGGVGTKGPGETQIETDRRAIRTRISLLKEKLRQISKEREVQRKGRRDLTRVAMVGYTNVGKSTLLRLLSGADVLVENRLFATLDTTVRQVALTPRRTILLSDTVGFIRKLPPHLVASFRTTLAEVAEADILLHVVDVSHPRFEEQIAIVNDMLDNLHANGKPTIFVFNKIDRLHDRAIIGELPKRYDPSVFISAARGINISALTSTILEMLQGDSTEQTITIKQSDYRTIAKLHEIAEILGKEYEDNSVTVRFRVSQKNMEQMKKLLGRRRTDHVYQDH
ncbi:MAG: GTPase HflX [Ignavibacteria bacterium]|nr:GTPase HflX [Ignavibacteria bacterium]MBI3765148.1 GTPase HflX [Ignavibacteriales bacterium]